MDQHKKPNIPPSSATPFGGGGRRPRGGRGRNAHRSLRGRQRPHQPHPPREPLEQGGNGDEKPIPPLEANNIRIIPLGGVEEIGRNMTAIEFGDDIIIVDCGFQFREDDTPGVDYILPNTKYLEDRQEKIRGLAQGKIVLQARTAPLANICIRVN